MEPDSSLRCSRGSSSVTLTKLFFTLRIFQPHAQLPNLRIITLRLPAATQSIYSHNYCACGHYQSSRFYLKHARFRRLDSKSSGDTWQRQSLSPDTSTNKRYINQAQHKPSAGLKIYIKNIKRNPQAWDITPVSMYNFTAIVVKIRTLWEYKSSLKRQIICMVLTWKHNFPAQSALNGLVVF
jgi:hypothetical protein